MKLWLTDTFAVLNVPLCAFTQRAAAWIPAQWHGTNSCVLLNVTLALVVAALCFFFFFFKKGHLSRRHLLNSPLCLFLLSSLSPTPSVTHLFFFFFPTLHVDQGETHKHKRHIIHYRTPALAPARRNATEPETEERVRERETPAGQSDMTTLFVTMASCFLYWLRETERTEVGWGGDGLTLLENPAQDLTIHFPSRHDTEGEILNWRGLTWCTFHPSN